MKCPQILLVLFFLLAANLSVEGYAEDNFKEFWKVISEDRIWQFEHGETRLLYALTEKGQEPFYSYPTVSFSSISEGQGLNLELSFRVQEPGKKVSVCRALGGLIVKVEKEGPAILSVESIEVDSIEVGSVEKVKTDDKLISEECRTVFSNLIQSSLKGISFELIQSSGVLVLLKQRGVKEGAETYSESAKPTDSTWYLSQELSRYLKVLLVRTLRNSFFVRQGQGISQSSEWTVVTKDKRFDGSAFWDIAETVYQPAVLDIGRADIKYSYSGKVGLEQSIEEGKDKSRMLISAGKGRVFYDKARRFPYNTLQDSSCITFPAEKNGVEKGLCFQTELSLYALRAETEK